MAKYHGGGGRIRTCVLLRGQIYSLLPLTTRPPLHSQRRATIGIPLRLSIGYTVQPETSAGSGNGQLLYAARLARHRAPQMRHRNMSKPYWIYGFHAVRAALGNPRRAWSRLLATPEAARKLEGASATPDILHRREIEKLLPPGAVHQGVALLVTPLTQPHVEEWLAGLGDTQSGRTLALVLDQVTDPHNVGAVVRSAAAFGASAVIVQARHSPEESAVLAKSASGGLERVPYLQVTNLARTLEQLKDAGFWCAAFDSAASETLEALDLTTGRWAFVFGAEGKGVRPLLRAHCDHLVRLPTAPEFGSLNVSNAAAVALYAFGRQKS
jgi:23S rRNA (guanosine2251-2'-O)-methyltransferase